MKWYLIFAFVFLFSAQFVLGQTTDFYGTTKTASFFSVQGPNFQQYYSDRIQTYYPILADSSTCTSRQDLLLQVAPAGCQPAVVRSDLLAEQNVPVFCQLDALRVNPLIDVKSIRSIGFSGNYPAEVAGVGFHPAQAALRTSNGALLGSPLINNVGYVVVVLKKNPIEKNLPNFVNFTLTARLDYRSQNAFGVGNTEFLLSEQSDADWKLQKNKQSFYKGNYYIRLDDVDENRALVSIYQGDRKVSSVTVQRGVPSRDVFLPGSYCQPSLTVNYNSYVDADVLATLYVDDDRFDVYQGSTFLDGKCTVRSIGSVGTNSTVKVVCGSESFDLKLGARLLAVGDIVTVFGQSGTWKISQVLDNGYALNNSLGQQQIVPFDRVVSSKSLDNVELSGAQKTYFDEAKKAYEQVITDYTNEQDPIQKQVIMQTYGQNALDRLIKLADVYGQEETAVEAINAYLNAVPQENISYYQSLLSSIYQVDTRLANAVISIDGTSRVIRLSDVRQPRQLSSADFALGNERFTVKVGENKSFGNGKGYFVLDSVGVDSARVTSFCDFGTSSSRDKTYTLGRTDRVYLCDTYSLNLQGTNVQKFAKISISTAARTEGETNVTVGIGIEKRNIKLAPDRTAERIAELNDTIKKWQSISDSLGNTVKTLKAACFATSALLTAKTFFTGLSGEALARQEVMRGQNGWTQQCQNLVNQGQYSTITQCYNNKSSDIEKDVSAYAKAIKMTNDKVGSIEKPYTTTNPGFFGGDSVDRDKASKDLITSIKSEYGSQPAGVDAQGRQITVNDLLDSQSYARGDVSYEQLRDLYTSLSIKNGNGGSVSSGTLTNVQGQINALSTQVQERKKVSQVVSDLSTSLQGTSLVSSSIPSYGDKDALQGEYYGGTIKNGDLGLNLGDKNAQVITYNNAPYLLVLEGTGDGKTYRISDVYSLTKSGTGFTAAAAPSDISGSIQSRISSFRKVDENSYLNKYENPEIKYYETDPYKGMPALVPFDTQRGWYVATKQTLPALNGIKAFESNGRPVSFWICNVGANHNADFFNGIQDDICRQFNVNGGQPLDKFPGLSDQQASSLVDQAIRALNDAAQNYGKKQVRINGQNIPVGSPAANLPGTQCQDFMSPDDCKLLFNVCDPVICPSSRCDLGGLYPVADVVQTGVIGSALLCLPNAREGIAVPVCLTGIKAGLDSYLSILKSQQQCLQESLATGRTVGICDAITSVYTCEFFWRQVAPVANILVPKLVEFAYGQGGTHGGGEYLTVQNAWDNAQASANYFTQSYAANSFEAFNVRSIDEAGTTFCRSFISAKGPNSFESLIEPDSPVQFYAWFSATPFSDATVPATSQYKVFYHIFAGNDQGVTYSVYLKDPPQTSYYVTTPTIIVDSGFIPRGKFNSQTKDFTAPEGYKQLCVRYNNKEECGFMQVSTDFAINYVRDSFAADEINRKDIQTEQSCISGSPDAGALVNPLIQSGVENAVVPNAPARGIVRICSTGNPGSGTDPTRFVNVGYCGDQKIGCWLDTKSVDNAITSNNIGIRNQTLQRITSDQKDALVQSGEIYGDDQAAQEVSSVADKVSKIDLSSGVGAQFDSLVREIDTALSKVYYNYQKAKLLILKGQLYEKALAVSGSKVTVKDPSTSGSAGGSDSSNLVTVQPETMSIVSSGFFVNSASRDSVSVGEPLTYKISHTCSSVALTIQFPGRAAINSRFLERDLLVPLQTDSPGIYQITTQCLDSSGKLVGVPKKETISVNPLAGPGPGQAAGTPF